MNAGIRANSTGQMSQHELMRWQRALADVVAYRDTTSWVRESVEAQVVTNL